MTQERNYLLLKAQLKPGKRYADGSVGIGLVTAEEIDTAKFAEIDFYRQQNGWFAFFPNGVDVELASIPKEVVSVEGSKTESQRLRAVLYVMWDQSNKSQTWPVFYAEKMDVFIELIKSKLQE